MNGLKEILGNKVPMWIALATRLVGPILTMLGIVTEEGVGAISEALLVIVGSVLTIVLNLDIIKDKSIAIYNIATKKNQGNDPDASKK